MQLQTACKGITAAVRRVGLTGLYGTLGASNASGDEVKKLDILSHELWVSALRHTRLVAVLASEEEEEVIVLSDHEDAKYCCVFDPLDGSSNIDCECCGMILAVSQRVYTFNFPFVQATFP